LETCEGEGCVFLKG